MNYVKEMLFKWCDMLFNAFYHHAITTWLALLLMQYLTIYLATKKDNAMPGNLLARNQNNEDIATYANWLGRNQNIW